MRKRWKVAVVWSLEADDEAEAQNAADDIIHQVDEIVHDRTMEEVWTSHVSPHQAATIGPASI